MIGLIVKLWLFILLLLIAVLVVLNLAGVYRRGTLSFSKPNNAPCLRIAAADPRKPHIAEVRWIWEPVYGWGCYFEYDISDSRTVVPMPK